MQLSNQYLYEECREFDFKDPPFDPIEFSKELVATMFENNGLGLAANQVGYPYRIFAMRGSPENFVCFNPRVVLTGDNMVQLDEGCLSYPGLICKVKRPENIKVRFNAPNGEIMTRQFTGMTARVFQHEMDHLDGEKFYDKANKFHRDQALRKWKHVNREIRVVA